MNLIRVGISVCLALCMSVGAPTRAFADDQEFHPTEMTVNGVEGQWLPKDEMIRLINAAQKQKETEAINQDREKQMKACQSAVSTSSAAVQQYKFAANQSLDLLNQCKAALTSETERCESVWRQPALPMGLGAVLGAAMCIGTARAQR